MTDATSRVHYFEEQFLRTQDYVDEQAYHVAARRRHNIAHNVCIHVVPHFGGVLMTMSPSRKRKPIHRALSNTTFR